MATQPIIGCNGLGLHSKIYIRLDPNGSGSRQVVKESVPSSQLPFLEVYPDQSRIAIRNEYLAIQYVREHTTIPVPTIVDFRDEPDLPVQLITEFVENSVSTYKLPPKKEPHAAMIKQLEDYRRQLHSITDPKCRSFAGPPLFGFRFENTYIPVQDFRYKMYDTDSPYVLCHGDLAWHNLLLNPVTWEIVCVLDWEYAGFYPVEAEGEYWRRNGWLGKMSAKEKDDLNDMMRILWSHREDITPPPPIMVEANPDPPRKQPIRNSDLRHLLQTVYIPPNLSANVGTILCEGFDLSRKRIAAVSRDMARYMATEVEITNGLMGRLCSSIEPLPLNKLASNQHNVLHIRRLGDQLSNPFITLANTLESSGASFFPLRDQFSSESDTTYQLEKIEKLQPRRGTEEEKVETELRNKAREIRGECRNLADQAFMESETKKWNAIKEFATSLLRLSTAAETILPYLADQNQEYPSADIDPERAWTEHRIRKMCESGGAGGWDVKVENEEEVSGLKDQFLAGWEENSEKREKRVDSQIKGKVSLLRTLAFDDKHRLAHREKVINDKIKAAAMSRFKDSQSRSKGMGPGVVKS